MNKNLMKYVPKEYKKLVVNIYEDGTEYNDDTQRENKLITVEWANGETATYTARLMFCILREFHGPDEYEA